MDSCSPQPAHLESGDTRAPVCQANRAIAQIRSRKFSLFLLWVVEPEQQKFPKSLCTTTTPKPNRPLPPLPAGVECIFTLKGLELYIARPTFQGKPEENPDFFSTWWLYQGLSCNKCIYVIKGHYFTHFVFGLFRIFHTRFVHLICVSVDPG